MGGFIIYSDTTAAVLLVVCLAALLTASVSTVDPYACTPKKPTPKPTELVLNCTHDPNLVVTGFIRGGHVKPVPVPKKQKQPAAAAAAEQPSSECPVPDRRTACWANPINGQLLSIVQDCVWKKAICSIPVNGQMLGHPCFASPATYIFAEQFKCVHQSRIVHLCSSSDREQVLTVSPSDGETFILSKGYPEIVAPGLNCNLTITTEAEGLRFESVYMHIHPKRKRQTTCEVDYLDIRPATPVAGSTAGGMRFCGKEAINYTSSATSRVQFVSGQEKKHYGGFVVRVTAVSSASISTQDRRGAELGINSSEFNRVKGSAPAAIPDKSRKASEMRTKNSTKP